MVDILDDEAAEGSGSGSAFVPEQYQHIVPHRHGFKSEHLQSVFENAGLTSFNLTSLVRGKFNGQDTTLFLAKGSKPST